VFAGRGGLKRLLIEIEAGTLFSATKKSRISGRAKYFCAALILLLSLHCISDDER
jgi:hypothetical protein